MVPCVSQWHTFVNSKRAKLLHAIEKITKPLSVVPTNAAVMVDAMALLQSLSTVPTTFGELSHHVFSRLMSYFSPSESGRVDFVADEYFAKSFERARRSKTVNPVLVSVQRADQATPRQWKRFLSEGQNKSSLIQFFKHHWTTDHAFVAALGSSREMYVTVGNTCSRLRADASQPTIFHEVVDDLCCSQEEADTRLILHASHAVSKGYGTVVVRSPDTDVAVIGLGLAHLIPGRLIFRTGTQQRTRYIDLTALNEK